MTDTQPELTGVTPHLTIRSNKAADAIDFYERAFDAKELSRHPAEDGVRLMHAHLALNGGALMLHDDFPEMMGGKAADAPTGVVLHIEVPDADAAWERALAAGATVRFPLDNQFWGQRYGQVEDPFGHIWSIGGPLKS
ncbi:VOC family protein [Sphingosinicella microcystinivorans]|uniref:VOC family protein n=1 Tax=Sphingosinicella microcystinivorans TaxID=335406 RepID=UPI0022F3AAE9|nr:VOC family protein [Sphingosinicella microcystinivorans]WBX83868.1 VOC family protein [Sphingosinicella microcystinivorans]